VDRPRIVLGLGNPGCRYRDTRHNLGFRVVDLLASRRRTILEPVHDLEARVATVHGPHGPTLLAQPQTFMNRSGRAAAALCEHCGVEPRRLLVVLDDADLELGRLRVRPAGGAGGHNGMRSILEALRTAELPRVRLGVRGVGRDEEDLSDYVLRPFDPPETGVAAELVVRAADAVEAILERGLAPAMNEFNSRSGAGADDGRPN
jgi:PTH1 family peptidyl-tRNA hydrolase